MGQRIDLQMMLESILGSKFVYFQPPETIKLKYPCIIYSRSRFRKLPADNMTYAAFKMYQVTVIYRDPDSDLPEKILSLPYCSHDRHYTADNLYHDVFTLYY